MNKKMLIDNIRCGEWSVWKLDKLGRATKISKFSTDEISWLETRTEEQIQELLMLWKTGGNWILLNGVGEPVTV